MSHTLEISDTAYSALERLASQRGTAPEAVLENLIQSADHPYYTTDEWLRHLGMTDEELATIDAEIDAEEAADADVR